MENDQTRRPIFTAHIRIGTGGRYIQSEREWMEQKNHALIPCARRDAPFRIRKNSPPRIVIADLFSRELQGGGAFWPLANHLFRTCAGGYLHVADSAAVRNAASNLSQPTFYSLERLGYVSEACNADWALVHPRGSGLRTLVDHYDLVLAAPQLMQCSTDGNRHLGGARGRVVTLLDEPQSCGGVGVRETMQRASTCGACSRCAMAHFQRVMTPWIHPLRPPYDPTLFARYMYCRIVTCGLA